MDAPVRAGAAGFADACAVSKTQRAAGPAQVAAGYLRRQQPSDQGGQEGYRLLQSIMNAGIAELGDPQQRHPTCCLAQRESARATRQREAQQARTVADLPFSPDRCGLQRQLIKVKASRKPFQQVWELVRRDRCRGLHQPLESYRSVESSVILAPMGRRGAWAGGISVQYSTYNGNVVPSARRL